MTFLAYASGMGRPIRVVKVGPVVMPAVIAGLILAIAVASIAGAIGRQTGWPRLLTDGLLVVPAVWRGQAWRLITFALLQVEPFSLLISSLMLYWFGADIARLWGTRRFAALFFMGGAASGAITCLLGLAWTPVAMMAFAGAAALTNGLVVVWGLLFPARELRLFGVVRLTGRWLVVVTVAGTVLVALFHGAAPLVPHFAAEALALLWLGMLRPWRAGRARSRKALAARGEAWSFGKWYEGERRRH
jgi:membrane associated rhomboid family serine protease